MNNATFLAVSLLLNINLGTDNLFSLVFSSLALFFFFYT